MPIPDFVVALRRHVGHGPLWLPGVTAVVVREHAGSEQVLLVQRSDDGTWGPVTGIVDPGEHPHVAAVREVLEETTVAAEVERLVWVHALDLVTHANGDLAYYLDHTFRLRWVSGEPAVGDDESVAVGWFAVQELPPMNDDKRGRVQAALGERATVRLG